jgi:hypothetical protein
VRTSNWSVDVSKQQIVLQGLLTILLSVTQKENSVSQNERVSLFSEVATIRNNNKNWST